MATMGYGLVIVIAVMVTRCWTESTGEEKMRNDLQDLVMSMQAQLTEYQTSQGRARSVLNVLREVQISQARDHEILKQRVFELDSRQAQDHQLIVSLTSRVSNNDWGIVNLKGEHDQVRHDLGHIKKLRHDNNGSTADSKQTHTTQKMQSQQMQAIQQLQKEMMSMKASLRGQDNRVSSEKIMSVDTDQSLGLDGVSSTEAPEAPTTAESVTTSESTSDVEDDEKEMEQWNKIERLQVKQDEQAAQLVRLQTQLINTTLELARLESRQLQREAAREHTELADMRHTLVNFTKQILGLQKKRDLMPNSHHVSDMLLNHNERIVAAEEMLYEVRSAMHVRADTVDRLNTSIAQLASRLTEHSGKADNVFVNADEQLAAVRTQAKRDANRLDSLEREMLNTSLRACRKTNMDLVQDGKLTDVGRTVREVDIKLHAQNARITKTTQGVTRLYEITKTQGKAVNNALNQMGSLLAVLPDVKTLKEDVDNVLLQLPTDCSGILGSQQEGSVPSDGIYVIRPAAHSQRVACEFESTADGKTTAWTIIQRRGDATTPFDRTWDEYKRGFGDPRSDVWIGNNALYSLTKQAAYQLRIEMRSTANTLWWAEYELFSVSSEKDDYRLSIAGYRGNATDAMRYSDGAGFSTRDADHDSSSTHCARLYGAGWWYRHCHYGNLNGRYAVGVVWFNQDVDEWLQMSSTVMKIRLAPPGGRNITNSTDPL